MKELDKSKFYDLSRLNNEEVKTLFEWYKINKHRNQDIDIVWLKERIQEGKLLSFYKDNEGDELWGFRKRSNTSIDAKELFYTLENVQVNCRGLTYDQVDEMLSVVDDKLDPLNSSFDVDKECIYFSFNKYCKLFGFYGIDEEQYKISYEKFMELFGDQVADVGKMVEPKYEVKYIAEAPTEEKPQHYSKGIDTFARMEANCTTEECLAFAKGNIDKYNWRTKGQDLEDYKKIIAYANWAIKLLENGK